MAENASETSTQYRDAWKTDLQGSTFIASSLEDDAEMIKYAKEYGETRALQIDSQIFDDRYKIARRNPEYKIWNQGQCIAGFQRFFSC